MDRNNRANQVMLRFQTIARFFSRQLSISFDRYIKNLDFIIAHKGRMERYKSGSYPVKTKNIFKIDSNFYNY